MLQIFRRIGVALLVVCAAVEIGSHDRVRAASNGVVISQVYGGGGNINATYKNDFIELFNAGSAPVNLAGWSVQYASATSNTWSGKTNLSGTIQPGHYFLIQEAAGNNPAPLLPTPDLVPPTFISMSGTAGKVALVASTTTLTAPVGGCPSDPSIVDLVSYGGNCGEGGASAPGTPNNTVSVSRLNSCVDTDNNAADFAVGSASPRNSSSPALNCGVVVPTDPIVSAPAVTAVQGDPVLLTVTVVPGTNPASSGITVSGDLSTVGGSAAQAFTDDGTNRTFSFALAGSVPPGTYSLPIIAADGQGRSATTTLQLVVMTLTPIHDIQGAGTRSPLEGLVVATHGIVTGVKSNGFFIEAAAGEFDADPNTSEGVFVFTSSKPGAAAAVGNFVAVAGSVQEYVPSADPFSPPLTEIGGSPTVALVSTGNALPQPIEITAVDLNNAPGIEKLEKYEGMRVLVDELVTVSGTGGRLAEASASATSNGQFVAVLPGTPRPMREAGIEPPNPVPDDAPWPATVPQWDGNPERIAVDTAALGGSPLNVTTGVRLSTIRGPLDYYYRMYAIDTEAPPTPETGNLAAQPVRAAAEGEFTVATMNLQRFYDTANDPGTSDVVLTAAAFDTRLAKASVAIVDLMGAPDIVGVEEMENLSTLQALADRIESYAGVKYAASLMPGHDIGGINVGLLARDGRVTIGTVEQLGYDTIFELDGRFLNDRPSLIVHATVQSERFGAYPVVVIVNHLRSLGSIDSPTDGARVRAKRLAQAVELAGKLQELQAAGERVVSVGDYNAFNVNDGYVDVIGLLKGAEAPATNVTLWAASPVTPPIFDLIEFAPAYERYSYVYDGNAQELDHILFTANVHANGVQSARMNADFPESLRGDATRPEKLADHDPVVGYFSLDTTPPKIQRVTPDNASLWPPNHSLVPVSIAVAATDDLDPSPACSIVSVIGNDGATSADWEVTGPLTLNLRAERLGMGSGRIYTIAITCGDASGNAAGATTTVTVAHDQRK